MATPQPQNEYTVNGKQIFNLLGIGNPVAVPPIPPAPLLTTEIDATGYNVGGSASTWLDTHNTVFNARALRTPPLSNPEILAIQKAVLVVNNSTTPTASIGIEADNSGLIGTYYGMNLFNNNNTDFGITSTFPYQGSVVFDQDGAGATTTTTAIKQGLITITDPTIPLATSFNATTLTSGASSATWADIISGSAGSNTLQEVLTAGNTATGTTATISLANSGVGYTTNNQLLFENTNATAGTTTGVPSVEFYKSGRNTVLNDVIMSQQFNAKAYTGTKTTFGKIECSITGASAPTGIDGALDFYTCINGVNQNVFRLNGQDNENNTFRPLDLNGNELKTSTLNLGINATSSTGTGNVDITAKAGAVVNINSNIVMDNSETLMIRNSANTIINSQGPSVVSLSDASAPFSGVNTHFINTTTQEIKIVQAVNRYTNEQTATGIYVKETDIATGVDTVRSIIERTRVACDYLINGSLNEMKGNETTISSPYSPSGTSTGYNRINSFVDTTGSGTGQVTLSSGEDNTGIGQRNSTSVQNSPTGGSFNLNWWNSSNVMKAFRMFVQSVGGGFLQFDNDVDANPLTIQSVKTPLVLTASSNSAGLGDVVIQPNDTAGDLIFNSTNIQSGSSGSNSGSHLRIKLNGTYYKIDLKND